LQSHPSRIEVVDFQSPDLARIHPAMTVAALEWRDREPIISRMDDTPTPAPAEWLEVLAESEAQLAVGKTVPGAEVMRGLRDGIARLEDKQVAASGRKAAARR
jgi:hypothetical protein